MTDAINFLNPIKNVLNNRYKTDEKISGVTSSESNKMIDENQDEQVNTDNIIKKEPTNEVQIEAELLAEKDVRFDYDFEKKIHFVVTKDNKGNIITAMPFTQYISLINKLK